MRGHLSASRAADQNPQETTCFARPERRGACVLNVQGADWRIAAADTAPA